MEVFVKEIGRMVSQGQFKDDKRILFFDRIIISSSEEVILISRALQPKTCSAFPCGIYDLRMFVIFFEPLSPKKDTEVASNFPVDFFLF
jgi:hypothetical protein